jgi:hypothetical protein
MLAGNLISGANTPGTKVDTNGESVDIKRCRLNVRKPGPPGMLFGMTYPVAEAQGFSTHITFDCQFKTSL